jgi:biotin operon repressor
MNNFATQLAVFAAALVATSAAAADTDWSKVDQALGRKGADQPGGVHKFSFPRSDLKVVVDGVELKPALALGSWVAFQPAGSDAMCMGDLVLTETEISAVMKRLVDDGIEISAVHNHLLRTSQPVVYMHIAGHGEPAKLADTIHAALALSKTPLTQAPPAPAASPAFDTASLDAALGFKGTVNGEVYQFSIPRAEAISEGGMSIPPSMGTAIGINFQATSAGKVATTGDFVLLGKEVNPVVKALRDHGIEVTALHSHMIDDSPHLYFMHFWANDEVKKVAQGLRAALDLANIKRGS